MDFFLLAFAAFLWGLGILAQRWGLDTMGPYWLNTIRFAISVGFGALVVVLSPRLRRAYRNHDFLVGIIPGFWLGAALVFQTYGLLYTSVTKNAFITTLYAVFVPVLSGIFYGQKTSWRHYLWVFIGLCGMALICNLDRADINIGDWLTLGCAITASLQILEVGRYSPKVKSVFVFMLGQCAGAILIPLIGIFWETAPTLPLNQSAMGSLAILILGSTWIGFLIQSHVQKTMDASTASMVCLLESPFAAFLAFLLMGESLTFLQSLGCLLILIAAVGAIRVAQRHDIKKLATR